MITTIIFDMNGVITDDEDLHELATQKVFGKLGVALTPDLYRQYCLGRTDAAAFVDLVRVFGLKDVEVATVIRDKSVLYQELVADNLKVYPGVIDLIHKLYRKYTLALTTSSTFEEVEAIVDQLGIRHLFRTIVCARDVQRGKPDPEPFLLTAKRLGVAPQECLVIEDSENGVRSAKAAGMPCVAITNTEDPDRLSLADHVVKRYSEIVEDLIQSLG